VDDTMNTQNTHWLNQYFILRWNGWRQFIRDFVVIQIGFLLFGLSIVILVKANLGNTPWVVLEGALINYLPLTLGQAIIVVAVVIALIDLVLKQPLGWGTLANVFSIGWWVDVLTPFTPAPPPNLWLQ